MSGTLFAKCQMLFENGQNMFVCCFDASCSIEEQFSQQVDAAVWEQVLSHARESIREVADLSPSFPPSFKMTTSVIL